MQGTAGYHFKSRLDDRQVLGTVLITSHESHKVYLCLHTCLQSLLLSHWSILGSLMYPAPK